MVKSIVFKYLKQLINAFIAGLIISLACVVNIYCVGASSKILGAALFGIGFFFISLYGYELYSFKAGYCIENKVDYLLEMLISIIGNFIGVFVIIGILFLTPFMDSFPNFINGYNSIMTNLLIDDFSLYSFGKALLAGLLIYLGYNTYKKAEQPIARFASLFVMAFIVAYVGLDEIISDLFYFNLSLFNNIEGVSFSSLLTRLVFVFLGNTLGAMIIPSLRKLKGLLR